ncbi:hypothetical protein L210DRAFT_3630670 [Boletus edulis BED1]|uniref:Ricin B lectin domain-containing protein n=1 Tax=Boletus edulis BED1 TaxID=1328754 RepID=A0AAD4GEM8_BOLED|nr:hypothetical protein L210DRAFT_3630670 [Boletus edulis BED1]
MPPFVPDGVYKIHNVQYSSLVVDLINGVKGGPIMGYIDRPSNVNDKWCIKNVGDGGNEITIESVSTPGNFASAREGTQLVGSDDTTVWTVVKVDVGYYLQSSGAQYVWKLTRDGDYAPMELSPFTAEDDTKWTFERIN